MANKGFKKLWGHWAIHVHKDARGVYSIKFTNVETGLSFKFRPTNQTPYMEYCDEDRETTIGSNLTTRFIMDAIREFYESDT